MTRVTIDSATTEKLAGVRDVVELCDESGRVLARVIPLPDLYDYEPWEPPIDEEEMRLRENSTEWYTTEEVLAHLRSLEK